MSNLDTFHLNVLIESTRLRTRKNLFYGSLVVAYVFASACSGVPFGMMLSRATMLACLVVGMFGTVLGRSLLSQLSQWVPWTKFGYINLKIIGCEPFLKETSPNLFLHKDSAAGQIADWIKFKTQAKGKVELFWAGVALDANKTLPVGIVNGSSLIAILHQEHVDESLQLGQDKPRIVRETVPTHPDFTFDPDEFAVPSFIRDMNDDEEEQPASDASNNFVARSQVAREKLSSLYNYILNAAKQLLADFHDTPWCHIDESPMRRRVVVPPTPPPQPVEYDDESESDTDYDEAPSFLREMNSIDDDDDDEDDEDEPASPSFVTIAVAFASEKFRRLRRAVTKKRNAVWSKVIRFTLAWQVADNDGPRISKARDMITLDDEDDLIRFEMPCRGGGHSMSQSSLIEYMKNQVLVEKKHEITCPAHSCSSKEWKFGDLREILQQKHDETFAFPEEELGRIEKALSANFIGKNVNCQRCPRCQIVVSRHPDTESYSMECFGCGWVYCWCCRTPWDTETNTCMNPKCTTAWRFVAAQMLKNCPVKHLDHMENVPTVRACPTCGQLITHVTACKHMRCSLCKTRFCFICMKPQKDGNWQCGYDKNTCKLSEVQRLDSLADGRVVRTDILEQLPPEMFEKQAASNMEEFRKEQEEFVSNVMASVRDQTYFN